MGCAVFMTTSYGVPMLNLPTELSDQALEDFLLAGARGIPPQSNWLCTEPPPRYVAAPERRLTALRGLMHCANELLRRESIKAMQSSSVLDTPDVVREYLVRHFRDYEAEAFVVLFLNSQHKLIAAKEMFRGTLTQTSVYPREVVKQSLALNAGAVVLAHNHPSGSVEPSRADEHLTQTLKSALSMVDVRVLDHFVVSGAASTSFAQRGLL